MHLIRDILSQVIFERMKIVKENFTEYVSSEAEYSIAAYNLLIIYVKKIIILSALIVALLSATITSLIFYLNLKIASSISAAGVEDYLIYISATLLALLVSALVITFYYIKRSRFVVVNFSNHWR